MQLKNPSIVHKIAEVDCDEKQNPFIALGMSCTSNLVQINHFKYESKNKKKSVNCSNVVCIITLHQKKQTSNQFFTNGIRLNRICRYTCGLCKIKSITINTSSYSTYLSAIFLQKSCIPNFIIQHNTQRVRRILSLLNC